MRCGGPFPALLPPRQTGLRPGPRETLRLVLLHSCSLLVSPHAAHGPGGLSVAPRLSQVGPAPAASPGKGSEMLVPRPLPGLQAQSRYSGASSAFAGLRRALRTGCTSCTAGPAGIPERSLRVGARSGLCITGADRQMRCVSPFPRGTEAQPLPRGRSAPSPPPPRSGAPVPVCAAPRCPLPAAPAPTFTRVAQRDGFRAAFCLPRSRLSVAGI